MNLTKAALAGVAVALLAGSAGAMQSGITPQGRPYVSGGASDEELLSLHERREHYSLWVVTAAMRSGAHLADVRVSIRDAKQQLVFDDKLDGPWLFVDLPLGRYEVQAVLNGVAQRRTTTIHRGDHHQVFFYFDTGDAVAPEHASPFERNPYGNDAKK